MEATFFNSRVTPAGLFKNGELETKENSREVASWELPTALRLLTEDWIGSFDGRTHAVGW